MRGGHGVLVQNKFVLRSVGEDVVFMAGKHTRYKLSMQASPKPVKKTAKMIYFQWF